MRKVNKIYFLTLMLGPAKWRQTKLDNFKEDQSRNIGT